MPSAPRAAMPSTLEPKRHVPLLLYGLLLFSIGIVTYLVGVLLGVPRYLLGLHTLYGVQQVLVWYSGIPILLGLALALADLLLFFDKKRFATPLRMPPLAGRGITVALTAYNDEESISAAVADFLGHPDVRRVIVVSNNSIDATFTRARRRERSPSTRRLQAMVTAFFAASARRRNSRTPNLSCCARGTGPSVRPISISCLPMPHMPTL